MSTAKLKKSDSNSSSEDGKQTTQSTQSRSVSEEPLGFRKDSEGDRFGIFPECAYCGWNIFIGVFLLFTTIFMTPGDIPSVVTQCFAVLFIFVGLLAFVLIFKSVRSIFIVLTVFTVITIILTSLTIVGFVYTIEGSFPVPELMMKNTFLEIVLGILLLFHIGFNFFCFFVFLKRSCKSQVTLESQHSHHSLRGGTPEKGSAELFVIY